MPIPYTIRNNRSGVYSFVTEEGLTYIVLLQSLPFPNAGNVYEFSFFVDGNERPQRVDDRIETTLIKILQDFWENDSNVAFFVCETDQNSPAARMRLFDRWYNRAEFKDSIMKHDREHHSADLNIYASLFVHINNPLAKLYIADFDDYIDILDGE